jgi:zinc protease
MALERKIPPDIKPVELKSIPEAELFYLKNGVPVYIIDAGTEELMRVEFIFDAGQVKEDFPLIASSTNFMLLEGSSEHSANEINSAFDFYGAFINPFILKDSAGVTAFFLNKHIDKILELCSEILFHPLFPETELENLKKKRLQSFLINREKVQVLATDKFYLSLFGPSHPYGRQIHESDFDNITTSQLHRFHEDFYSPSNMAIIVSGRIPETARAKLDDMFGRPLSIPNKKISQKEFKIAGNGKRKDFVEKKGAVQSAIRIGSVTINKRDKDFSGLMILDTILGGYFGSRLMKNIREEKGYTYGINSSLVSMQKSGYNFIATEVGIEYTSKTIDEIYKEIRILQTKPVEKDELQVVRNYMAGEMVRMFDGPFALAESFKGVWEFGLDNTFYYGLAEKIKTIEPDEIMSLANTYYNIDDLYEIIAGPK